MIANGTSQRIALGALICAAMVVAIHVCAGEVPRGSFVWWWDQIGHYGVFLVAVPFFFVCSGFFLGRHCGEIGWWPRECLKRVRSLLLPYLIWSAVFAIIGVGASVVASLAHGRDAWAGLPTGWSHWLRVIGIYPFDYPLLVPLWYVRSLLVFVVLSPLLVKSIKLFGGVFLFAIWFSAFLCSVFLSPGAAFEFVDKFLRLDGLFYFCCGLFFSSSRNVPYPSRFVSGVFLVIGLSVVLIKSYVGFAYGWQNDNMARLFFVPPILIGMWALLPVADMPTWVSRLSFPVYLLHIPILYVGGLAFHFRPECLSGWFFKYAFAILVSVLINFLLRRLVPMVANVVFGGR